MWSWGSNRYMQLGYETEFIDKSATPMELFAVKEAVLVACGGMSKNYLLYSNQQLTHVYRQQYSNN